MNYLLLCIIISVFYFFRNNSSIVLLGVLIIYILYNDNLLPKSYFELPKKRKKLDFEFPQLKKLFSESDDLYQDYLNTNESSVYQKYKLKQKEIQEKISSIYFSFPYHKHKLLDRFFKENYDLNSR